MRGWCVLMMELHGILPIVMELTNILVRHPSTFFISSSCRIFVVAFVFLLCFPFVVNCFDDGGRMAYIDYFFFSLDKCLRFYSWLLI